MDKNFKLEWSRKLFSLKYSLFINQSIEFREWFCHPVKFFSFNGQEYFAKKILSGAGDRLFLPLKCLALCLTNRIPTHY